MFWIGLKAYANDFLSKVETLGKNNTRATDSKIPRSILNGVNTVISNSIDPSLGIP